MPFSKHSYQYFSLFSGTVTQGSTTLYTHASTVPYSIHACMHVFATDKYTRLGSKRHYTYTIMMSALHSAYVIHMFFLQNTIPINFNIRISVI
jgi:hypothetical protein